MTSSLSIVRNGSIALIAFVLLALPMAAAHAADFDSFDFYPDSSYDFYPEQSYDFYQDSSYDFYPEQTSYDFYPDTSYGYMPSYGGSYFGGGYISGPSYLPTSYPVSSGSQSQSQSQAQSSSNNNTNVNNNIITINTPAPTVTPAPTPVYTYDVCQNIYGIQTTVPAGYQLINGNCIGYYNTTPYVALSAVPYTGLDLGFWGTIAYWGFLVLWCLVAAYLVVVKKVQNRMLRALNSFLFGDSVATSVVTTAPAATVSYSAPAASQVDAIDDFILSQVNRQARRA